VFIPNVRVRFLPALGAGVLAGTIWQLAQWAYVSFQFGAAKYNAIYGSFAQLPMFLVWVFVSWFIVLLGAEMCFAFQNLESFEKAAKYERVSTEEKLCAGLAVLMDLTRRFREEADLPDMDDLSGRLQLPENLLADVLALLVEENVVARVDDKDHERYALRRPPERMLLCDVRGMFVNYRSGGLQPSGYEHYDVLRGALEELAGVCRESGANVSLAELYRRAAGKSAEDADRDAEAAA
jgi:membrane protein